MFGARQFRAQFGVVGDKEHKQGGYGRRRANAQTQVYCRTAARSQQVPGSQNQGRQNSIDRACRGVEPRPGNFRSNYESSSLPRCILDDALTDGDLIEAMNGGAGILYLSDDLVIIDAIALDRNVGPHSFNIHVDDRNVAGFDPPAILNRLRNVSERRHGTGFINVEYESSNIQGLHCLLLRNEDNGASAACSDRPAWAHVGGENPAAPVNARDGESRILGPAGPSRRLAWRESPE
ncbi:MAG: hypothetical protein ACREC1_09545, partial [Methylovirgula sp.]